MVTEIQLALKRCVSIDRLIIRSIKNGHDLVTYHESWYLHTVVRSLSALNNLVASIMLLKESADTEN